jgi:dihydroxyacid dehydratase (EC 4.2.1.9)
MPGMMMAAIRADLPSVFLYGGSIMPGHHRGQDITIQNVFEACGRWPRGR